MVAHGTARLVTDEREKIAVLTALVEKAAVGRSADSRPPSRRELAETAVLALPLREVSVRDRTGGVNDDPADLDLPYWAGVLPLRLTAGLPEPAPGVTAPLPAYLRPARRPGWSRSSCAASTWCWSRWTSSTPRSCSPPSTTPRCGGTSAAPGPPRRPRWPTDIRTALTGHQRGVRVPWVQRCAATGAVVGTTSYYDPDPDLRSMEIGFTQLGRAWWRTGINTEAKLLLLTRAFEELDAIRVTWQTEHPQRALAAGHRAARRHPRGDAAGQPAAGRRHLAGVRALLDAGR